MSWTWTLPISIQPRLYSPAARLRPETTRVVIPTFRDWDGARETVESILGCSPRPGEIVLVNDNAEPETPRWVRRLPIVLVDYPGNRGPGFARNAGVAVDTGRPVRWLYFTDTACTRDPWFFEALAEVCGHRALVPVAMAGPVHGVVVTPALTLVNYYMTVEGILHPPVDASGPQAIVTANAAVERRAFRRVGGFDTSYPFAAGEDLDLGLRLRALGPIGWAEWAVVRHRFDESAEDFQRRFLRYGAGNAHLAHRYALPDICPAVLVVAEVCLQPLADLQVLAMRQGYERHKEALRMGAGLSSPARS